MNVLTMKEAAKMLRMNYFTLSRKANAKEVPSFRVGTRILFRLESLNAWITEQEQPQRTNSPEPSKGVLRRINE